VPYSRSAHPPVVALVEYASVCLHVCVRRCRGRPRIASLWDSLTTAGVFPRVSRRRPFTGVDLREIRPPNFCSFYRPLASDSSPFSLSFVVSSAIHGDSFLCWMQANPVQRSCLLERMFSLRQNHGKHPRAYYARAGIRGTSRGRSDRAIMFTGPIRRIIKTCEFVQMTILITTK